MFLEVYCSKVAVIITSDKLIGTNYN